MTKGAGNNCIMGLFGSKQQPKDPVMENPWREVDWSNREQILQNLKQIRTSPGVDTLRILVVEPICAGKSSFIISVNTALQGHDTSLNHSLTDSIVRRKYAVYTVKDTEGSLCPFVFGDTMGMGDGESGACTDDIINIMKGHVPEGYIFNPSMELTAESSDFNKNPTLKDKVHCLVFAIPSDNISIMRGIIAKLKPVLQSTCDLGIPQVVIMSKVDKACPLVYEDLKIIYRSQKIEDRMSETSLRLGVPMNYIFPVKNYEEEITTNPEADILILTALKNIMDFANSFVRRNV